MELNQKFRSALAIAASVTALALPQSAVAVPFLEAGPAATNVDTFTGTSVLLNVLTVGTITDLNFFIQTDQIWSSDIDIFLTSPDSTTVHIFDATTDALTFFNVTFDDESSNGFAPKNADLTGDYRPDNLLSAFDGKNLAGTWTLFLQDLILDGDGTALLAWNISGDISTGTVPVPEPGSIALLGLGLAGLGLSYKKRKKA